MTNLTETQKQIIKIIKRDSMGKYLVKLAGLEFALKFKGLTPTVADMETLIDGGLVNEFSKTVYELSADKKTLIPIGVKVEYALSTNGKRMANKI